MCAVLNTSILYFVSTNWVLFSEIPYQECIANKKPSETLVLEQVSNIQWPQECQKHCQESQCSIWEFTFDNNGMEGICKLDTTSTVNSLNGGEQSVNTYFGSPGCMISNVFFR